MKLFNVTIASILLSSLCYGCAEVVPAHGSRLSTGLFETEVRRHVHVHTTKCDWDFDENSGGTVVKGTLKVDQQHNAGGCREAPESDALYISGAPNPSDFRKVLNIPAVEFITEGSTRYCYINSAGGMSCIIIP
jgi:hypothetical protein